MADFYEIIWWCSKFNNDQILLRLIWNLDQANLPSRHTKSQHILGPIGSAVLTFIWYKQTSQVYID